jgi:hypothetical protein
VPERDSSVLEAKKTIFRRWYGLPDLKFLFIVELGTCVQILIFTKGVEGCKKKYFPRRGMQKFTYKGRFLTIKIAYEKFLDWKSKWWKHALVPPLHIEIFISKKHWNLDFWRNFKVSSLGRFGQIWADFPAFTVAESMPELGLKSSKPHNFSTVSPNITCNGSLECYNPYL